MQKDRYDANMLAECSEIVKREVPVIRVKTTDVFTGLTPIERQTLYWAERKGIKLLNQTNKRY